jgi:hypothetical protein
VTSRSGISQDLGTRMIVIGYEKSLWGSRVRSQVATLL